jgi:hypothetical protein
MRVTRFPIAALLGVVALAAPAFAALRGGGSREWDSAWLGAVLLALLVALLAVHRRGKARAFWLGFVLWGTAYLVAIQSEPLRARLPTTRALILLSRLAPMKSVVLSRLSAAEREEIEARMEDESDGYLVYGFDGGTGQLVVTAGGVGEFFYPIGHSICTLLIALAGGLTSSLLRRPDPVPAEANPPCPAASSPSPSTPTETPAAPSSSPSDPASSPRSTTPTSC